MTQYSFFYSMSGLLAGLIFLAGALFAIRKGRSCENRWRFTLWSAQIEIVTRAPGVILATIGAVVIYLTRFRS